MTDYKIARGWGGRPWVAPEGEPLDWGPDPDARKPLNAEAWERPSDIAGTLDKGDGLGQYDQTRVALGIAKDRGLYFQFQALASEYDDAWQEAKGECKSLIALAHDIGGGQTASGKGSALHRLCHVVDEGQDPAWMDPELEPWLVCYSQVMFPRFKVLADEKFVRCDELKCAGNFDRLLLDTETGRVHVADIKTGWWDAKFAMKATVQDAIYAHGRYYDQRTGACEDFDCDLETGLLIHLPIRADVPECSIYPLDLEAGWRIAKTAIQTVADRKMTLGKRSRLAHHVADAATARR